MTNDLISRQAAIEAILHCENHDMEHDFEFNEGLIVAMNAVSELPTAGCEYWDTESNYCALYRPAAVPTAEKKGEWIPVMERPPEEGEGVLWCTPSGYVCSGCVLLGHPIDDCGHQGNYIAWMPLPDPFRKEEANERF